MSDAEHVSVWVPCDWCGVPINTDTATDADHSDACPSPDAPFGWHEGVAR